MLYAELDSKQFVVDRLFFVCLSLGLSRATVVLFHLNLNVLQFITGHESSAWNTWLE